jgi:hypothetical protein
MQSLVLCFCSVRCSWKGMEPAQMTPGNVCVCKSDCRMALVVFCH